MFEYDNEENLARRRFSRRAMFAGLAQVAGFSALGWRLFDLQVLGQNRYAPMADENRISLQVIAPKRGRILDRAGRVLADSDEMFRATLTPALAGDVAHVLSNVRRIVPLTQDEVERLVRRAKRSSRHTPLVVASDLTFEQVASLDLLAPQLPGVRTEIAWRRKYRQGRAVGHIVGYMGSFERASADDDAVKRLPGARAGKAGIEAGMERELRGTGGSQKIEVDARGHVVRSLESQDPKAGRDVVLSIDTELQKKVVSRLEQERCAACVALDVTSGEVVVMASVPGYDAADFSDGIADDSWQRLVNAEDKPLLNRATGGQYPPGATFQIVTALAALKLGVVSAEERVVCAGSITFSGHTFHCRAKSGHGAVGLQDALRESCDIYFLEMARRLGIQALSDMALTMGLGQTFSAGLAQQRAGLVPDAEKKLATLATGALDEDAILTGVGQGYLLATPLQLAVMAARLASGRAVEPSMIKRVEGAAAVAFSPLGISDGFLDAVRRGLEGTVNGVGGSAVSVQLSEGLASVAGLAGASQISRMPNEGDQETLAWDARAHGLFVAYVPADVPRFAVAAVVEHGGTGARSAAPLVRDVIAAIFEKHQASPVPVGPPASGDAGEPVGRPVPGQEG